MISNAKRSILIQTPYFIPDASLLDALRIACLSGIDVNIMIPNKPDHAFVYWATLSYIGELLKAGATVYIYDNGFIHAKTIVVDDEIASVGTANIDVRSFRLNFEVNAFIYDITIAKNWFLHLKKICSYPGNTPMRNTCSAPCGFELKNPSRACCRRFYKMCQNPGLYSRGFSCWSQ